MHETVLNSGWDTFLFAVPALFMLVLGIFRLDELLVAPRRVPERGGQHSVWTRMAGRCCATPMDTRFTSKEPVSNQNGSVCHPICR